MFNDYLLRERSVTAAQLHTPHSKLHTFVLEGMYNINL